MTRWIRVLSLLLALLVLAACSGAAEDDAGDATEEAADGGDPTEDDAADDAADDGEPAGDATPIRIGLSTPLTGPQASIGEGFSFGVQLAIEDLGGEIAGHPIELFEADNLCAPADAVTAVRRLIDTDEVHVMLGSSCSGATLAALPIIAEAEVPNLSVTSSNPTIYDMMGVGGNEWAFRLNLDDLIIANTLAEYMADQGTTSVFLVGQNNDFGRGAAEAYAEALPAAGITYAGEEFYDDGTADFRPILTSIRQSGADGLMTIMVEHDSAVFFRQAKEVGLEVDVYSRGGVTSPLFLEETADDPTLAEGAIGASYWTSGIDPEAEARFEERWGSPATVHRMMAYYGVHLVLADAIERSIEATGEVSRAAIRDAMEEVDLTGTPLGDIAFDDHNQAYPFLTIDTITDGQIELIDTIPGTPRS